MSASRRGDATPTLTTLPDDILLHILHLMTPTQLALFSQLSCHAHSLASDPSLWASIAHTHFGLSPSTNNLTPATVSALARTLVSRWWLVMGAFVPGVAVHFRKGFAEVRACGGTVVPLSDGGESAYVFGGRHAQLAIPVHMPSLSMDFFLDPAGPFPVAGLGVRIVHVAESGEEHSEGDSRGYVGLPASVQPPPDVARARIKLNDTVLEDVCLHVGDSLETTQLVIKPCLLRTKPSVNTLTIEYDRQSSAAYWVKEVLVLPTVMPMPKIDKEQMRFNVSGNSDEDADVVERLGVRDNNTAVNRALGQRMGRGVRSAPRTPPRTRETSPTTESTEPPTSPRRAVRLVESEMVKFNFAHDVEVKGKIRAKYLKQAKMPKHMYHRNYYRSPRGNAPISPRAKGR